MVALCGFHYCYDFLWVVAWGQMDLRCLWCVPRFGISHAPFGPADETTVLCPPATPFGSFSIVGNRVFAGCSRVYLFSRRRFDSGLDDVERCFYACRLRAF